MERRFTEKQVAQIVQRAAEIQSEKPGGTGTPGDGVTEGEVFRVGRELGLGARAVDQAMREMAVSGSDTGTSRSFARDIERTILNEDTDAVVAAVVEEFVPTSTVVHLGSGLSYTAQVGATQCAVHVSARGARSTLRIRTSAIFAGLATWLPAVFLSAIAWALIWDKTRMPGDIKSQVVLGTVAALWITAAFGYRALVRSANRKVQALTDRIVARMGRSVPVVVPSPQSDEVSSSLHQHLL